MTALDTELAPPPSRARLFSRLRRNRMGTVALVVVVVSVVLALGAPLVTPLSPLDTDFEALLSPPSLEHPLGTDELGRSQLSRVVHGLRVSLGVAVLSIVVSFALGVPLGLLAGYHPRFDGVASRVVDVVMAFPTLVLAVGLAAILGPSLLGAILAIGVGDFPGVFRVTRGETLRIRTLDFVAASTADGNRDSVTLFRHILPNATNPLVVQATVLIPSAILSEAALSFLGLGVRPPAPSLGIMLANAQGYLQTGWWMAVFPGLAIVVITFAFNLLGDAIRDALDPRSD